MMFFRAISRFSTSATRHATKPTLPTPLIKKYPVYLHLIYPSWDTSFPTIHQFGSAKEIKTFLSDPIQFLVDSKTGNAIRHDQIHMIDPNIIYDVAGSGLPDRMEGNLKRDQVRDKVFKRKAAMALREALQAEDQKLIELSRVVKDPATGLNVDEWEVIFQGSDGSIIFLETQSLAYQMSKKHIDKQFERLTRTLASGAMGKEKRAKLYLAAYYWPDDKDCILYARSKGYGIIQPNGRSGSHDSDLTVHFKAKELCLD